ncbi:MAG: Gfo/Idh/MocA family oxidoreductase [Xanthomonadales bacterium]|nr:Gfo/Idh/MocA family oxidoreductase [Xanthomonadales bacterium]
MTAVLKRDREKVRWGIFSTGRITHRFVQDFAFVPNGEVVAVASRSQESADAFAARYGIARAYEGYPRLLDDPQVDAVYVATPHTMHFRNTADAIQAGKHVLCEKPFTVGAQESRDLLRLAEQSSVFVMEGMWTWFLPAIRKALEWVRQGRIGALQHIEADFGYPLLPYDPVRREYNAELAGGCLLDMGIYPVALALLFTGRDPGEIQVVARKARNGVEDDLVMLFDYSEGEPAHTASLATSFRCRLPNWAHIIGEEGYIAIPDFWRASECRLYQLDECIDSFCDGRTSLGFNYETEAASRDMLRGLQQNSIIPWSVTVRIQEHMDRVRKLYSEK